MQLTFGRGLYQLYPAPDALKSAWVRRGDGRAVTSDWTAAWDYAEYGDEAVQQRLKARYSKEINDLTPSWTMDSDYVVPMPPGEELRPYQKAAVNFAMQRASVLIADVPRLGKSASAIGVFNKLQGTKMLIVCPAVAKPQWRAYCERWMLTPPQFDPLTIQIVQGLSDTITGDVLIINWDILAEYEDALVKQFFDVVIFDECRAMKNERSRRTQTARKITKWARRIFLDGTPINTRPIDLWVVVRECDRWGLGKSRSDFAKRYCDAEQPDGSWDDSGSSNMEELQRRMRKTFMIRREKKDVQTEINSERIPTWIPNDQVQALLDKERAALMAGDTRPLTEILEAWGDTNDPESEALKGVREALATAKLPHVYDYVDRLLAESDKVVVFAYHRSVTTAIAAHYENSAMVIGGITPKQRQAAIDRFQNDPACRVFVGNITACNSAISLSAAHDVVYAELSWVPTEMEQSEERIWLPGKAEALTSHWLMFDGSLDAQMYHILVRRMHAMGAALNRDAVI